MTTTVLAYFPSPPQGVWYLGPVPIRAYALCIIAGIIVALVIGDRRWAARGGERGVVYDVALWAVPFGLIGGRVYHLMTDWRTYFGEGGAGLPAALRIWEGGLGIWGAVAFGGVGAWIACRRRGIPLPAFGDAVAPGIVLAQAIGRLGNYFNQELYGRETTVPWGMEIFYRRDPSGMVDVHSLDGISTGQVAAVVHPTFLYELLWNVGVFILLIWADRRYRLGHGRLFALYVAAYCAGRFWVELLRDDTATEIAGIRINVFTATFVFIGAVVYMLLAPKGREDPLSLRGRTQAGHEDSPVEEFAEELVAAAKGSGIVAAATVAGEHAREDAIAAGDVTEVIAAATVPEDPDTDPDTEFIAAVEAEEMAVEAELQAELAGAVDDTAAPDPDAGAEAEDPDTGAETPDPDTGAETPDPDATAETPDPDPKTEAEDADAGLIVVTEQSAPEQTEAVIVDTGGDSAEAAGGTDESAPGPDEGERPAPSIRRLLWGSRGKS